MQPNCQPTPTSATSRWRPSLADGMVEFTPRSGPLYARVIPRRPLSAHATALVGRAHKAPPPLLLLCALVVCAVCFSFPSPRPSFCEIGRAYLLHAVGDCAPSPRGSRAHYRPVGISLLAPIARMHNLSREVWSRSFASSALAAPPSALVAPPLHVIPGSSGWCLSRGRLPRWYACSSRAAFWHVCSHPMPPTSCRRKQLYI